MKNERARRQHYFFVHEYLREKCLDAPFAALQEFMDERAAEHLKTDWASLGLMYRDPGDGFIAPDGIEVVPFGIGDRYKCAILVFPRPERLTEAFMSAVVAPSNVAAGDRDTSRYFTLEYDPRRPNRTFVGQWIGNSHFNLGDGPRPTVENFKNAVIEMIEASENELSFGFADNRDNTLR